MKTLLQVVSVLSLIVASFLGGIFSTFSAAAAEPWYWNVPNLIWVITIVIAVTLSAIMAMASHQINPPAKLAARPKGPSGGDIIP
jgi:hypothetical protein